MKTKSLKSMLKLFLASGLTVAVLVAGMAIAKYIAQKPDSTNPVPAAEARKRIEEHIAFIENRNKEMLALYYAGNAKTTMKAAFDKTGVSDKVDPNNWAGWLSTRWLDAAYYYSQHVFALSQSLNSMQSLRFVSQSDLAYLDNGMQEWKQYEQQLQRHFEAYVDFYAKQGFVQDKLNNLYERISKLRYYSPNLDEKIKAAELARLDQAVKALLLERDRLDEGHNKVSQSIKDAGNMRFFEAIKAWKATSQTASNKPRTQEKKELEVTTISGSASGANDRERP